MADEQQQQPKHSLVRLENKTEHVLHITLAGGDVVSVPPSEDGKTQTLTFSTAEERGRFEAALNTETVQQWLRDQHLVVHGGDAPQTQQSTASTPGPQVQTGSGAQSQNEPPSSPTSPATRRGRGGQE